MYFVHQSYNSDECRNQHHSILVVLSIHCYAAYCIRRCHTSAPPSLAIPGMTGIADSNALDCLPSAIGLLTVPLLGLFPNGFCLA